MAEEWAPKQQQQQHQGSVPEQDDHEDRQTQDYSLLLEAGFEPAGESLWKRDGLYFGKQAALQYAWQGLR